MTGMPGRTSDALPLGPPRLQWSFNRDGELRQELIEARDKRMGRDTSKARRERQDLVKLAQPQGGVAALAGRFPNAEPIPGVTDNGDSATRAVPTFGLADADGKAVGR